MPDARSLYGVNNDQPATAVEWNEHVVVDGVAGKKVFPINLPPTVQMNPSLVFADYSGPNPGTITKTVNGTSYEKTFTYDGLGNVTNISAWVQI